MSNAKIIDDLTLDEAQKIVQATSVTKVVHSLIEKGLITVYENVNDLYKAKKETFIFLNSMYNDEEKLKELFIQLEKKSNDLNILLSFLHLQQGHHQVAKKELLKASNATSTQLLSLIKKEIFEQKQFEIDRIVFDSSTHLIKNELSFLQQETYKKIQTSFQKKQTVLLKGITGSGKTHIYLELINECIQRGKQALYLLPEIALTAQIIRKLQAVFGNRIAVYHSRFSNNERVEIWKKVQDKKCDIIIGARSALLLPFSDLGLIIVDEEHDTSYKQHEPSPRYHARDTALILAHQSQANIILGTATPSLESFYNCSIGKYTLVELTERFGNASLPNIQFIDLKLEQANKAVKGIFSTKLIDAIKQTIENKKQVILFQNRRGYSPLIMCSTCAWIPHCKYCDVSLTFHKSSDQLHCHYCGTKTPVIKICAACGNSKLISRSFGTEKIEDDVKLIFPNARVQRFDVDSLKNKNKHTEIIQQFEKRNIDILVGTQMLVKGLDFEHVRLVGVLSADSLLSHPDFRVNERTFQLLEQVSGRAGRKDHEGQVLVQLYKTSDPTLLHVKNHDYPNFYKNEIEHREEFQYPPFTRLIRITLKHRSHELVAEASMTLAKSLQNLTKTILFGPAEPSIARIRNQYLQEILLKTNRSSNHSLEIKKLLKEKIVLLNTTKRFTTVRIIIDVDPY
jgi:primosomal protein N' (replication factor Y) (superfamily II helicase)